MSKKVLIVEDNQDMRIGLKQFLEREGYIVLDVPSCEEGIDAVDETRLDAAVVDINLPGKSGFEMIEYIRETGSTMPVIAMTARDGIEDKIKGFDLGFTDYIVKPFNLRELSARMNAHLGRNTSSDPKLSLKTKNYSINLENLEFKKSSKSIELTHLEFRIMAILMQNNHKLTTLDDLISFVWGESEDIVNPPIRIHIANLRKKIGDKEFKIIRTIAGTGYIFNDPLEQE